MPFYFDFIGFEDMIFCYMKTLLQLCYPKKSLTWFSGKLARFQKHPWKNWMIRYFIYRYQVNLKEAQEENISTYPNFNSFFTRKLKAELRPIPKSAALILSPVDGTASQNRIYCRRKDI